MKYHPLIKNKPNAYEITEFVISEIIKIFGMVKRLSDIVDKEANMIRDEFTDIIKYNYTKNYFDKVSLTWYSTECYDINLGILQPKNIQRNLKLIEVYRKQLSNYQGKPLIIEWIPINEYENMPIFVENVFKIPKVKKLEDQEEKKYDEGIHVFILIHGLDGSYVNMLPLMNEIVLTHSNSAFILPKSIKREKTRNPIDELGRLVAREIKRTFIEEFHSERIGKISFIWHSLGGVIAREAIPYLSEYFEKFYTFCSLGSPHLGIMNSKSFINFGIWITELFSRYDWITQLKLKDSINIEDSFMYRLSQKKGLQYFDHVYFFSSHQDTIVPYYSARVQIFRDDLETANSNKLFEMSQNILSNVKRWVTRVDVDFKNDSSNFESMIGKTAHISFLNDPVFLRNFISRYTIFW